MDGNMAMILGIIAVVFVVVCVFLSFVPLGLWISALSSGVHVSMGALIGMKIRHIKPHRLVQPLIKANKAGLGSNISQLETHFLAGGNVDRVINALIAAQRANIPMAFEKAVTCSRRCRCPSPRRSSKPPSLPQSRRTALSCVPRRASPSARISTVWSAARAKKPLSRVSARAS